MCPEISIIVPVYNVEPYINKCIDSILAQTFTDFELILVNDGSPDNCGRICDEYANKDSRIKVIHKENGGLSEARNVGLDTARGNYIGFVDSDDWIEPDMYELLHSISENNKCDIASCTSIIHYNDKVVKNGLHPLTIYNKEEALKTMLIGKLYDEVVWTKLIKRDLIRDIRFPVGLIYEDTAFTYKLIHKAEKVCCIGQAKYHYIKRENSTMDQAIKDIRVDGVIIYDEMYKFIDKNYKGMSQLVTLKLANNAMVLLNLMSIKKDFKKNYKKQYDLVVSILNKYYKETIRLREYPLTVKLLLSAAKVHPSSYKLIINIISRRKAV
ncbi:glycosyltransferase [Rossellomorea aquimaris]|uniref:Glycosyltransferase involved in cell wall biosynthesis n=1 Tax=Rossellomorea aquimaris TaxID=189382 RepID=A0A366EL71_9BACI|nr:glycosyltransferase [Rossellomorea aquimaris]RBP03157.1 glycosyltransferase involved in cell wall biosynthesis [Rossellomorea aquimaris]